MMPIAYFDCFSGAGGDMIVAALIDADADADGIPDIAVGVVGDDDAAVARGDYYTIPLRTMIPRHVQNLLFAGLLVLQLGQATVGVAACEPDCCAPRIASAIIPASPAPRPAPAVPPRSMSSSS